MSGWDDDEDLEDDRRLRRSDEVLRLLFDRLVAGTTGRRHERLQRAEQDLRRCLEVNADRLFTDLERDLLVLEEQLDPVGAAARVASAEVVLLVLPIFLDEARWHGTDPEDRRLRIRLAADLTKAAVRLPELQGEISCLVLDVEFAVRRARSALRGDRLPS